MARTRAFHWLSHRTNFEPEALLRLRLGKRHFVFFCCFLPDRDEIWQDFDFFLRPGFSGPGGGMRFLLILNEDAAGVARG